MSGSGAKKTAIIIILVALTLTVFGRLAGFDFVGLDDIGYVTANPAVKAGLTWRGAAWAFTGFRLQNWHPLLWLSHMLDVSLFGVKPAGHHLMNLLFHVSGTAVLFSLLAALTGRLWPSAAVAALFAVHPLHVESVAWVAERKDVLSTLFWFLALSAYAAFLRRRALGRYLASLGLFCLGLMVKPMLVTFPLTLILMDFWPLGRAGAGIQGSAGPKWKSLIIEKIPFLALAAIFAAVTMAAQYFGHALRTFITFTPSARLTNALTAAFAYLVKMAWPARLAVFYPHPVTYKGVTPIAHALAAAAFLAAVTWAAAANKKSKPYLIMGWLWYLITLFPVLGLVQVGAQAMADRYAYVTLIGIWIALVWMTVETIQAARRLAAITSAAAAVITLALAGAAFVQTGTWRDSETLFRHAIAVTGNNWLAHNNLGVDLEEGGRWEEAVVEYRRALTIRPNYADAYNNLGNVLLRQGNVDEALIYLRQAAGINPRFAEAAINLGIGLVRSGQTELGLAWLRRALDLDSGNPLAYYNLGIIMLRMGEWREAALSFRRALALDPGLAAARTNLGYAYLKSGDTAAASAELRRALAADPRDASARHFLESIQGR